MDRTHVARPPALAAICALAVVLACGAPRGGAEPPASASGARPSATPAETPLVFSPLPEVSGSGASVEGATPAGTSAPVATAPPATPTPTPDPAVWRFEGVVVDEAGQPLEGVCVAVGPKGCQQFSPRTDGRGLYFIDMPQVRDVTYDITFIREGFRPVFLRTQPSGPTVFNLTLPRP